MDLAQIKIEESEGGGYHSVDNVLIAEPHAYSSENDPQRQAVESFLLGLQRFAPRLQQDAEMTWNFAGKQAEELNEKDEALRKANLRIQELETELRSCQMRLSKYIPDYQLSDNVIKEGIIRLRENVLNWAEDFPDAEHFRDSLTSAHHKFQFPIIIQTWEGRFPGWSFAAQSEILMCMTWWSIWDLLFRPLVVAPLFELQVLETLIRGICTVNPKKDVESIELWRSDTFRAYTTGKCHQNYVGRECSQLTARLREIFDSFNFRSHLDERRKFSRLEEQIIAPAAKLAISLSCSPETYQWHWYEDPKNFPGGLIRKEHLGRFNTMSIETHNRVGEKKFSNLPQAAVIGKLLFVMFPALSRRGQDEECTIWVEKATILIRVNPVPPTLKVEVNSRRLV